MVMSKGRTFCGPTLGGPASRGRSATAGQGHTNNRAAFSLPEIGAADGWKGQRMVKCGVIWAKLCEDHAGQTLRATGDRT